MPTLRTLCNDILILNLKWEVSLLLMKDELFSQKGKSRPLCMAVVISSCQIQCKKNASKDEPIHLFGWYNSLLIISCYSHYRGRTKPALTAWTVILFEITKQQFQIHCVSLKKDKSAHMASFFPIKLRPCHTIQGVITTITI